MSRVTAVLLPSLPIFISIVKGGYANSLRVNNSSLKNPRRSPETAKRKGMALGILVWTKNRRSVFSFISKRILITLSFILKSGTPQYESADISAELETRSDRHG